DWSSDVCSSDLQRGAAVGRLRVLAGDRAVLAHPAQAHAFHSVLVLARAGGDGPAAGGVRCAERARAEPDRARAEPDVRGEVPRVGGCGGAGLYGRGHAVGDEWRAGGAAGGAAPHVAFAVDERGGVRLREGEERPPGTADGAAHVLGELGSAAW